MFSVSFLGGEKVDRALHLSLAALLGNDIYNFGELVGQQQRSLTFLLNPFVYMYTCRHDFIVICTYFVQLLYLHANYSVYVWFLP